MSLSYMSITYAINKSVFGNKIVFFKAALSTNILWVSVRIRNNKMSTTVQFMKKKNFTGDCL